jgi:hypothetical protein
MNSSPDNKGLASKGLKLGRVPGNMSFNHSHAIRADGAGGLGCGAAADWTSGSRTRVRASNGDKGGDNLQTARSLRPYLQGYAPPGTNRSLRDATGRRDPDFYRLFDKQSPNTFQADGLLISCNLSNLSRVPITISLLDRGGNVIQLGELFTRNSQTSTSKTVAPGNSFVFDNSLTEGVYYIKVTSTAPGQHRYELNLPIINS